MTGIIRALTAFTILMLILTSGSVQASFLEKVTQQVRDQEMSAFYGAVSVHWITEDYTNSTHHMVGARIGPLAVGTFKNSYGLRSYFAGYYHDFGTYNDFNFFGMVGVVRGYTVCYGDDGSGADNCPLIAGGVAYEGFSEKIQPAIFQLGDATTFGLKSDF